MGAFLYCDAAMRSRDPRSRNTLLAVLALVAPGVLSWGCNAPPAPPPEPTALPRSSVAAGPPSTSSLDVDGDGTVGSHTDALLILRYVSGFRGETLIEGVTGKQCTRCTAPEIEAYLDSL